MPSIENMTSAPIISIVMATINDDDTLEVQVNALIRQECSVPFEIIISDNGTNSDNPSQLVKSFESLSNPTIRFIDASSRKGSGAARNIGVKNARGKYILFCDADDLVSEGWIESMYQALQTNDLVCGALDFKLLNEKWLSDAKETAVQQKPLIFKGLDLPYGMACNLGIRKDLHLMSGGFDENLIFAGDTEYCLRMQIDHHARFFFVKNAIVHYHLKHDLLHCFRQRLRWASYHVLIQTIYDGAFIKRLSSIKKYPGILLAWKCKNSLKLLFSIILNIIRYIRDRKNKTVAIRHIERIGWCSGKIIGIYKFC
jgi:glycosyltransferase involved in cell wall biosynthesis